MIVNTISPQRRPGRPVKPAAPIEDLVLLGLGKDGPGRCRLGPGTGADWSAAPGKPAGWRAGRDRGRLGHCFEGFLPETAGGPVVETQRPAVRTRTASLGYDGSARKPDSFASGLGRPREEEELVASERGPMRRYPEHRVGASQCLAGRMYEAADSLTERLLSLNISSAKYAPEMRQALGRNILIASE